MTLQHLQKPLSVRLGLALVVLIVAGPSSAYAGVGDRTNGRPPQFVVPKNALRQSVSPPKSGSDAPFKDLRIALNQRVPDGRGPRPPVRGSGYTGPNKPGTSITGSGTKFPSNYKTDTDRFESFNSDHTGSDSEAPSSPMWRSHLSDMTGSGSSWTGSTRSDSIGSELSHSHGNAFGPSRPQSTVTGMSGPGSSWTGSSGSSGSYGPPGRSDTPQLSTNPLFDSDSDFDTEPPSHSHSHSHTPSIVPVSRPVSSSNRPQTDPSAYASASSRVPSRYAVAPSLPNRKYFDVPEHDVKDPGPFGTLDQRMELKASALQQLRLRQRRKEQELHSTPDASSPTSEGPKASIIQKQEENEKQARIKLLQSIEHEPRGVLPCSGKGCNARKQSRPHLTAEVLKAHAGLNPKSAEQRLGEKQQLDRELAGKNAQQKKIELDQRLWSQDAVRSQAHDSKAQGSKPSIESILRHAKPRKTTQSTPVQDSGKQTKSSRYSTEPKKAKEKEHLKEPFHRHDAKAQALQSQEAEARGPLACFGRFCHRPQKSKQRKNNASNQEMPMPAYNPEHLESGKHQRHGILASLGFGRSKANQQAKEQYRAEFRKAAGTGPERSQEEPRKTSRFRLPFSNPKLTKKGKQPENEASNEADKKPRGLRKWFPRPQSNKPQVKEDRSAQGQHTPSSLPLGEGMRTHRPGTEQDNMPSSPDTSPFSQKAPFGSFSISSRGGSRLHSGNPSPGPSASSSHVHSRGQSAASSHGHTFQHSTPGSSLLYSLSTISPQSSSAKTYTSSFRRRKRGSRDPESSGEDYHSPNESDPYVAPLKAEPNKSGPLKPIVESTGLFSGSSQLSQPTFGSADSRLFNILSSSSGLSTFRTMDHSFNGLQHSGSGRHSLPSTDSSKYVSPVKSGDSHGFQPLSSGITA